MARTPKIVNEQVAQEPVNEPVAELTVTEAIKEYVKGDNGVVVENVAQEAVAPEETVHDLYKGVTTAGSYLTNPEEPPIIRKTVVTQDPDLEVVTPMDSRKTFISGRWYNLERGVQIAVPKAVASLLKNCKLVVEKR